GKLLLDVRLGETGEVAAELIIVPAERRAVDGGAEQHGPPLAVAAVDAEHGNASVRQAARIDAEDDALRCELAAIHGEVDDAAAPGQACGLHAFECLHDHVDDLVLELPGVL